MQNSQRHGPVGAKPEPADKSVSESSSFDSSSDKSSVKKRIEKEKLKRILALKEELLRRQKEKPMTLEDKQKFLN